MDVAINDFSEKRIGANIFFQSGRGQPAIEIGMTGRRSARVILELSDRYSVCDQMSDINGDSNSGRGFVIFWNTIRLFLDPNLCELKITSSVKREGVDFDITFAMASNQSLCCRNLVLSK